MKIKLFTASLLSLILIAGCSPYDPLREDFWVTNLGVLGEASFLGDIYTENIYPNTTLTYDIGSPAAAYLNGYFQTLYTWNGTGWDAVTAGGLSVESDPIYSASNASTITAADIAGWTAHPPLTTGTHGVGAGNIVGTTLLQTLTNKTLDTSVATGNWTAVGQWWLPATYYNGDLFTDRWLLDESNTIIGVKAAGADNLASTGGSEGLSNTIFGHHASNGITLGSYNTAFGSHSLFYLEDGDRNVALGANTGNHVINGTGNVFLGAGAGGTTDTSNQLFINNSETDAPLIWGNFASNDVTINGELSMATNQIHDVVDPTADQDAATKKYVDDSHIPIYHSPTSITVNFGTYTSGNLSSLTAIDGVSYVVTEANGAPPCLTVTAEFSGITNFHHVQWYSKYTGSTAHHIMAKLYNFTTASYIYLDDMSAEATYLYHSLQSPPMANYISGGVVRVQFDHIQNGVNTHTLLIDYLGLVD